MFLLSSLNITGPISSFFLLILGFLALLVVDLIIALIEGVTLTLLHWNPFRQSLTISLIMNITSGIPSGILLILLQRTPFVWLPISFVISLLIEGFVMSYFKRETIRQNSLFVFIANVASYTLFILPAYYFGTHP
jgi:hypothetical protein